MYRAKNKHQSRHFNTDSNYETFPKQPQNNLVTVLKTTSHTVFKSDPLTPQLSKVNHIMVENLIIDVVDQFAMIKILPKFT